MNATRRQLLRSLAWAPGLALVAGWVTPLPVLAAAPTWSERRPLMGTWVDILVAEGPRSQAQAAANVAYAEMVRLAALMSRHDPASELSGLNRSAGRQALALPAELFEMLLAAQVLQARTGGAFDARIGRLTPGLGGWQGDRIPDADTVERVLTQIKPEALVLDIYRRVAYIKHADIQIDLGGAAKLPILAAGLGIFKARNIPGVMINGGGDVLTSARADGLDWRIGIRDPLRPSQLLAVLPLRDGVVASSGDYERFVVRQGRPYHHIVDPRSGRPTQGVAGVTLVADSVEALNGLGSAAMVAGISRGPALLARCGVDLALMVASDGGRWVSAALSSRLQTVSA